MENNNNIRLALFGAAPDTPNMGVSALFMSTVAGLCEYIDNLELVVFDNGLGYREENLTIDDKKTVKMFRFGARGGTRYYRSENLFTMLVLSRLGKLGALLNKGVRLIDSCDAVLDVSGGDSFSDIYGMRRFNNVNRPKIIAINRNIPLILLPQTYGPYTDPKAKRMASDSVKKSTMAWARDDDSYKILISLLGKGFSDKKHKCGVDMAFRLSSSDASTVIEKPLSDWVKSDGHSSPFVGINVSGLIYKHPEKSRTTYRFKADYKRVIIGLIRDILEKTETNIVLISHVMDIPGHYESDYEACVDVKKQVNEKSSHRVIVAPATLNESQVKWLISKTDWFCGTRMHSTIAGLSTLVPTAAISYSDKTKGVFETCDQGEHVVDPRVLDTDVAINRLYMLFAQRDETKRSLKFGVPSVIDKANKQMSDIVDCIKNIKK